MSDTAQHDLIDFAALAAQLTNEQKILAALLRIEALLTPAKPAEPVAAKADPKLSGSMTLRRGK